MKQLDMFLYWSPAPLHLKVAFSELKLDTAMPGIDGKDLEASRAAGSLVLGGWLHKAGAVADRPAFELLACNTTESGEASTYNRICIYTRVTLAACLADAWI